MLPGSYIASIKHLPVSILGRTLACRQVTCGITRLANRTPTIAERYRYGQIKYLHSSGRNYTPAASPFVKYHRAEMTSQKKEKGSGDGNALSEEELLERIKNSMMVEMAKEMPDAWAAPLLHDLKPVSATLEPYPTLYFDFTVHNRYLNFSGVLHGGAGSTLFDVATTMALHLVNSPKFWFTLGVSRMLNCTYLLPAPEGKTVGIKCEILNIGKKMSQLRGEMFDKESGKLIMTCEHLKVNVDEKLLPQEWKDSKL